MRIGEGEDLDPEIVLELMRKGVINGRRKTLHRGKAVVTFIMGSRELYDFAGWSGTGLSAPTMTVTIAKGSTGNRSYTATWAAKPLDADRVNIGDLYYNLRAAGQTAEVTSQSEAPPFWTTSITTANIPESVVYLGTTYSVTGIGDL